MKIAITGSSGFVAGNLKAKITEQNVEWLPLKRNENDEQWRSKLLQSDVLINLAGAPVIQRWTPDNMQAIFSSRVKTTKRLVRLLNEFDEKEGPKTFISASAIGIYPNQGDELYDEYSEETGNFFLSEVVKRWEAAAKELNRKNTRLVIPRIGIVLGKGGGLLSKTLTLFKWGLGGPIASGRQSMAYIHIGDLVRAFEFFIKNEKTNGVYNLVSPELIDNKTFTKSLGQAVKRPTPFRVPAFALRLLYGKAASIMIDGEKVKPTRLLEDGFEFKFDNIDKALHNIVEKE